MKTLNLILFIILSLVVILEANAQEFNRSELEGFLNRFGFHDREPMIRDEMAKVRANRNLSKEDKDRLIENQEFKIANYSHWNFAREAAVDIIMAFDAAAPTQRKHLVEAIARIADMEMWTPPRSLEDAIANMSESEQQEAKDEALKTDVKKKNHSAI